MIMKKIMIFFMLYLVMAMIFFPAGSYEAAKAGFKLWYEVVLPALLPFFICAELLLALGAMDYFGYYLEPLMRPLFNLPGSAALAIAMGYSSGFPTGAAITASLFQKGNITKEEGARLIAFTNNSSPLFIIISVATGIFKLPSIAWILIVTHYLINILIGIILGRLSPQNTEHRKKTCQKPDLKPEIIPIGKLLRNAAIKAGSNILIIGCYLIFFSVLTYSLELSGIFKLIFEPLTILGLTTDFNTALGRGIFEMTIGINTLGETALPIGITLPVCAGILAWGGLSVQAQVAAMVSETDIGLKPYLLSRIIHMLLSFSITAIICRYYPITETVTTGGNIITSNISSLNYLLLAFSLLLLLLITAICKYKQQLNQY